MDSEREGELNRVGGRTLARRDRELRLSGCAERDALMAPTAPGFIRVVGADDDAALAGGEALRPVRGRAAHHAHGERLGDVLGHSEELRHRLEGPAEVVLIEARANDA